MALSTTFKCDLESCTFRHEICEATSERFTGVITTKDAMGVTHEFCSVKHMIQFYDRENDLE